MGGGEGMYGAESVSPMEPSNVFLTGSGARGAFFSASRSAAAGCHQDRPIKVPTIAAAGSAKNVGPRIAAACSGYATNVPSVATAKSSMPGGLSGEVFGGGWQPGEATYCQ